MKFLMLVLSLSVSFSVLADYRIVFNKGSVDIPNLSGPQPVLGTNGFQLDANGVTISCDGASEGDAGTVDGVEYRAVDNNTLIKWHNGVFVYKNICTTLVTDMSEEFRDKDYVSADIVSWDTSNVTNMYMMFFSSRYFDLDLGSWDTSSVTDMYAMFYQASAFNKPIGNWDVSNVTNMANMFRDSAFNENIGNWDVGNVTNMSYMFYQATSFNQNLSEWCVGDITNKPNLFDLNASSWTEEKPVWGTCP
jgi:surface protein